MTLESLVSDEEKKQILQELDLRIGGDVTDLVNVYDIESELILKRDQLQGNLSVVNYEVPTKLSTAITKAEKNSKQIEELKERSINLSTKIEKFLEKTKPLREGLDKRFTDLAKLDEVVQYLLSFQKLEDICFVLKTCGNDERAVEAYGELRKMCVVYVSGHRAEYFRDTTLYWHNVLKERFAKKYEAVLKSLKWPLTAGQEQPASPSDIMTKFTTLTRYLLLLEKPKSLDVANTSIDSQEPCLPVKYLLIPLKKRFTFHFTGSRQTARIDRPEWFLTQTLTWIKDHQEFLRKNVQPVADRLQMKHIKIENEFNDGLIALAAERLHTVLGLYHAQSLKGEIVDVDAAFAHAVDETLGFHKELIALTSRENDSVLSVLTKAETFVKWLSVEKKYALAKMDESLSSWWWRAAAGDSAAGRWVPRAADWLVALLHTLLQRYRVLPQPGHRLQFLELQLELIEEWRVRLTQLLNQGVSELADDAFLAEETPDQLTAVVNAAHHTRTVLLQWAHSLHYLQLHYYRSQFQQFTQQHQGETVEKDKEDVMSLNEVEERAQELAMKEIKRDSATALTPDRDSWEPNSESDIVVDTSVLDPCEECGVFGDAPALLGRLRDAGLREITMHIMHAFKAGFRDYRKIRWHALPVSEEMSLSVSLPLAVSLAGLTRRVRVSCGRLAPALRPAVVAALAGDIDDLVYEDLASSCWFNTGGTMQFTHDVKRNLIPALVSQEKTTLNPLPKVSEACVLLNLDYDDARRLRGELLKAAAGARDLLAHHHVRHLPPDDALVILNHRTDMNESSAPSVMELF